jgi:Abnormal spindle-like microcephaly-assoc'd, ASPM-SPD-2-Hydin/HYDIN/CFA65/VesB-like, Ig-like domain/Beta-propeller repeat
VGKIGGAESISANVNNARVAVDASGNAYLAGVTYDKNFQITPGTLTSTVPGYPLNSTFVLKVDSTGKLLYSTVIPGNAAQDPLSVYVNWFLPTGIAVDSSGQVVVAGTGGQGLPTTQGVVSPSFPNTIANVSSPTAGYILQLNAAASAINYGTYIPGTDILGGMAIDSNGNIYVAGETSETTLPTSANAYQKVPVTDSDGGISTGYILKLNSQVTSVLAATYLDGTISSESGGTSFSGIALDSHSNVFVGGRTSSTDFPLQNPFIAQWNYSQVNSDMVLAEMSPDLSSLMFGSFLSSTDGTFPGSTFSAITIDPSDNLVTVGTTYAKDYPTTAGSFQAQPPPPANPLTEYVHTFISKINMATAAPSFCPSAWGANLGQTTAGSSSTQTVTITNCGNAPLDFTSITSSVSTITASQSCGSIAPAASCPVTLSFAPVDDNTSSGTITFSDNAAISPQVIQVSAQGVAPDLEPASNPFDFGHLLVGTQGPTVGLFLSNNGNAPLAISHIAISGGGFSIAQNSCTGTWPAGFPCVVQLVFSPPTAGTLSGSLTITSNDPVHPQLVVALTGTGDSAYGVPGISMVGTGGIPQPTLQINNGPTKLQVTGSNFYPSSIVKLNGVSQQTTFEGNGLLQVTIAASSLTAIGEVPLTVVNPAPGGGESAPTTLTLYQTLQISPSSVVSVPGSNLLYVAIPASAVPNANTIMPIDPTTGTPGTPIPVGNDPRLLAPSDDGKYLYVALFGDQTVQRINLQTQAVERTFPFSPNPFCQGCSILSATDLHAVPGSPQEVVLAQGSMISLYNDSGLVNYVPNAFVTYFAPTFSNFAFAGNPATIYALPFTLVKDSFFSVVTLDSAGLHYTEQTGTNYGGNNTTGNQVVSDGTLLYTSGGQVWDPSSQAEVGTFPINTSFYPSLSSLTLDPTLGAIYGIGEQFYGNSFATVVSAFGEKSLALTGTLAFPQISYPTVGNLLRWGSNGFAFLAAGAGQTDQELYLTRSSVLAPTQPNPAPTLNAISPASAIAGSGALTLTLTGTNFVSTSTVSWNGSALQTTYISGTKLSAMVPDSDLAQSGTASVTVTNPAPGGGTSSALIFTIVPAVPSVSLSASSISFGDIALGASSSAQFISITNAGNAALSVASIAASGDFSQTNNCGTTLAINATCQVAVTFTPTATGQRTGTLTITDNAGGSPQAVSLSGNGTEQATISPGSGGSTTATVSSGMAATYNLTLSGGTGLNGTVSLACTGAPQNANCSIAPATLTLPAGGSVNFTVTVSTTATQAAYLPQRSNVMMAGLGLLSLGSVPVLLLFRRQLRISTRTLCAVCAFTMLAVLTACGGGGHMGGAQPTNPAATTPPGTYTLTVTASAGSATVAQKLTLVVQ